MLKHDLPGPVLKLTGCMRSYLLTYWCCHSYREELGTCGPPSWKALVGFLSDISRITVTGSNTFSAYSVSEGKRDERARYASCPSGPASMWTRANTPSTVSHLCFGWQQNVWILMRVQEASLCIQLGSHHWYPLLIRCPIFQPCLTRVRVY